jgi:SHS2 domain-containing protein
MPIPCSLESCYNGIMPFEEMRHTADCSIRVWAADLPTLFSEAAVGMYALSGVILADSPRIHKEFITHSPDPENLLVAFLSELIFLAEQEFIAFDHFSILIDGDQLRANMTGAPIKSIKKSIKAATYHNLQIHRTDRGAETEIVFDV